MLIDQNHSETIQIFFEHCGNSTIFYILFNLNLRLL